METIQSKRERFKRLALKRTNEVLKKLEILGNCGNKHSYDYTQEQAQQIFKAVEEKLNEVKGKFKAVEDRAFHF